MLSEPKFDNNIKLYGHWFTGSDLLLNRELFSEKKKKSFTQKIDFTSMLVQNIHVHCRYTLKLPHRMFWIKNYEYSVNPSFTIIKVGGIHFTDMFS